ncbi:MAG: hypothetical protein ABSG97_04895 [Sedimentisphaerales bacterium]|jgi:hypothetical protein
MSSIHSDKLPTKRNITLGWIDSASISQVVQAFDIYPNKNVPWEWDIPLFVTRLLISTSTRNIGLAPGISPIAFKSDGPIGGVTRKLLSSGIIARRISTPQIRENALEKTKDRINTSPSEFQKRFKDLLKKDGDKVSGWLDWSRRRALVEHFQLFGNLFDERFIPEIALLLNMGENDVRKLYKATSQLKDIEVLSKQKKNTTFCNEVLYCYLIAAILRGIYHDNVAASSGYQVAHHPIRTTFLSDLPAQPLTFEVSSAEDYLANIVLHDALLGEKNLENRLGRWAENITKIRNANKPGYQKIDLRPKKDPSLAFDESLRAARTLGIYCIPRSLENILPTVFGKVAGKVIGYVLMPFIGTCATLAEEAVVEESTEHLARRGIQTLYGRHGRLVKLAKLPPGRLSIWRKIFPI